MQKIRKMSRIDFSKNLRNLNLGLFGPKAPKQNFSKIRCSKFDNTLTPCKNQKISTCDSQEILRTKGQKDNTGPSLRRSKTISPSNLYRNCTNPKLN